MNSYRYKTGSQDWLCRERDVRSVLIEGHDCRVWNARLPLRSLAIPVMLDPVMKRAQNVYEEPSKIMKSSANLNMCVAI